MITSLIAQYSAINDSRVTLDVGRDGECSFFLCLYSILPRNTAIYTYVQFMDVSRVYVVGIAI